MVSDRRLFDTASFDAAGRIAQHFYFRAFRRFTRSIISLITATDTLTSPNYDFYSPRITLRFRHRCRSRAEKHFHASLRAIFALSRQ